jgi:outer membrane protein assembly factor BamB
MKLLIPVFIISCLQLLAQSAKEPKLNWKYQTGGILVSAPVSDGTHIYIGSYDSSFYCLGANTGKLIWRFKTNGQIGSTASLIGEKIYFFSNDGKLYCLNKQDGKIIWQFKTFSGALPDRRYDWPDYYQSSPTVSNGLVYFGAGDGRVYALNAVSGQLRWSYQTGDVVHTTPAVENEKLVVGSFDGHMYCLNKETGTLIWRFKTTGHRFFPRGEINGNPVIHRNKVFFGARDYNLYAIDLEAGYCHWLKTFAQGWALPVTPNDSVIYIGTSDDRLLLAIDVETGLIRWKKNLGFNIFGGIALMHNTGYSGTLMGKLFCINLDSGDIVWTFLTDGYRKFRSKYFQENDNYFVENIGKLLTNGNAILKMYEELGGIFSTPAIVGGTIVVASNDGTLYCLG